MTPQAFYSRLSEIVNVSMDGGDDGCKYNHLKNLKKQLYTSGFTDRVVESKMREHPVLSYDLRISHALSLILRHGGKETKEDVAREMNWYDAAYTDFYKKAPEKEKQGMLPVLSVASQHRYDGKYIASMLGSH